MAYDYFQRNEPDGATQTGPEVLDSVRKNQGALNDAIIIEGMYGWDMTTVGGTPDQPDELLFSFGTQRNRQQITWGSSGGAEGNPTTVIYSYSSDNGNNYDTIGTETFVYDVNGNVISSSWSP